MEDNKTFSGEKQCSGKPLRKIKSFLAILFAVFLLTALYYPAVQFSFADDDDHYDPPTDCTDTDHGDDHADDHSEDYSDHGDDHDSTDNHEDDCSPKLTSPKVKIKNYQIKN